MYTVSAKRACVIGHGYDLSRPGVVLLLVADLMVDQKQIKPALKYKRIMLNDIHSIGVHSTPTRYR